MYTGAREVAEAEVFMSIGSMYARVITMTMGTMGSFISSCFVLIHLRCDGERQEERRENHTLVISFTSREVCLFMLRLVHSHCHLLIWSYTN